MLDSHRTITYVEPEMSNFEIVMTAKETKAMIIDKIQSCAKAAVEELFNTLEWLSIINPQMAEDYSKAYDKLEHLENTVQIWTS